ncbi:hypothetical protein [uncultured Winogradskyella sp.]|uniref:hypothetical protein n=1 Tax=uncultured Winogradskyella sp. TaxID=395353 RepID=UPI002618D35C|nr:hypothetical protein [uncultured Winogradskyella sp.]
MINKVFVLFGVVVLSVVIASAYGAIHNQITYSISEEYFTKLKFNQFGLWNGAFGNNGFKKSAFVGVLATWWFGAIIGLIIGILTIFIFNFNKKLKIILKQVFLVLVFAVLAGIIGFLVGKLFINDLGMNSNFISNLDDPKAFVIAGSIHNFSYLGGLVGLFYSVFHLFKLNKVKFN